MSLETRQDTPLSYKHNPPTATKNSTLGGWFLPALVLQLVRQFMRQWRAIPRQAWNAWWQVLVIGAVVNALLALGLTFGARAMVDGGGLQAWDERMLRAAIEGPVSFHTGIIWQAPGSLPYLVPLVWLFIAFTIWRGRPFLALSMAAIYFIGHLFVFIGWGIWNRERPTFVADGIAAPPLHSFPSGHVAITMGIYGLLAYLWIRASRNWLERLLALVLCALWVGLVGMSRLATGTHWPSDVLAGAVLGMAWLIPVAVALQRAESFAPLPQELREQP